MTLKKEAFITYLLYFDDFLHISPGLFSMHFLDADFGLQVNGTLKTHMATCTHDFISQYNPRTLPNLLSH